MQDILKRISKLEQTLYNNKDYKIILAFYNDTENNYLIKYYYKGVQEQYTYNNVEDFYKDKKVNIKDKNTFIRVFHVCRDRTAESVYNSQ